MHVGINFDTFQEFKNIGDIIYLLTLRGVASDYRILLRIHQLLSLSVQRPSSTPDLTVELNSASAQDILEQPNHLYSHWRI